MDYLTNFKRKEAEIQLAQRDQLLTKLSQQIPGAIYQYQLYPDGSSCFPFASDGLWDVYEVTPKEAKENGAKVFTRIHGEDYDRVMATIEQSAKKLSIWEEEYRVILPEKGYRWLRGHARPEKLSDGSVLWHGFFRDVTDGKEIEETLQKSEESLRSMFNNHESVMLLIEPETGKIVDANIGAEKFYGFTGEQLKQITIQEINLASQEEVQRERLNAFEEKRNYFIFQHLLSNGEVRDVEVHSSPIEMKNQRLLFSIVHDITDRKKAEKEAQIFHRQLTDQNKLLELKKLEIETLYNKLDEGLSKAREIHERNIPSSLPQVEGVSMASYYSPAETMGGDLYNVIVQENKLIFYLSDVTGHGLEGALVSAFLKESIGSYIKLKPENILPEEITKHLYEQYNMTNYPCDYFISLFLGVLDLDTYELSYTGAGFQEPMLVSISGNKRMALNVPGLPISNVIPLEKMNFVHKKITLTPGSTIMISTDGLTEQIIAGKSFHKRKDEVFFENSHLPPEFISRAIIEEFQKFNNGLLQGNDDITYLILQINLGKNKE